jgi:hypothetical protein
MCVDEAPVGHRPLELCAQLAHVHVHRAIAWPQLAAPHRSEQLFAREDRSHPSCHRHEQFEFPHRQRQRRARREHEAIREADLELADTKSLRARAMARHGRKPATACAQHGLRSRDRGVKNS